MSASGEQRTIAIRYQPAPGADQPPGARPQGPVARGPFGRDGRLAEEKDRGLAVGEAGPAAIERNQCVTMELRLRRPGRDFCHPPAIEVGEPPDEFLPALDIGKGIDDEFEREGIEGQILADAADLQHLIGRAEQQMLVAVRGLQQRAPAGEPAQGNDAPHAGIIDAADIGRDDAGIIARAPEDVRFEPVKRRIGERSTGPTPPRAETAGGHGEASCPW